MKRFPGEVLRYGGSNGTKIHLTDEQIEWLVKWYPVTENARLAKAMGIYLDRVRAFARELGLEKSEKGMKAIRARQVKRATKTKLKAVVLCPYTKSQSHHRHNAFKRGYLLDYDCSEGSSGRYTLYYDDETQRSPKFEANCIKDGFQVMPDH